MPSATVPTINCRVAVLWIDWYPYHVARFLGLTHAPTLDGRVAGIEMVGGVGVHAGLKFSEGFPDGLQVETLLPNESWTSASKVELARLVWRSLSRLNPESVLVPGYYTLPAVAAALWARLHSRKSVLMTESCSYDHKRSWWKECLKRFGLHLLFNWAVAGGKDHIAYLQQLGFPLDRIVRFYDVVDNGMYAEGADTLRKTTTAADHNLPPEYFLFVGRFAPEKNVLGLLAAWLIYRFRGGTWPLVLAGDGPELPALRSILAKSHFAADVHFAGLRSSKGLLPLYAFASCFVLPSTREPWGLVVNEAMAAGLPALVSTRCGCAPDLVQQGITGWLFDPGNERLLGRNMLNIEALTPGERERMGRAAAERIKSYSPERFGLEIASIADAQPTQKRATQAAQERP